MIVPRETVGFHGKKRLIKALDSSYHTFSEQQDGTQEMKAWTMKFPISCLWWLFKLPFYFQGCTLQ